LHTGEWKNVDETWRQLYSYSSIFKSFVCLKLVITSNNEKVKEQLVNAVQCCDMGLIMGAPVLDGLLNTLADGINSKLSNLSDSKKSRFEQPADCERKSERQQISVPLLDKSKLIEVFNMPSIEKFISEIMDNKPVIVTGMKKLKIIIYCSFNFYNHFTGAMDFWPALGKSQWSVDYLRKIAGYRTVPIEIGSKYTDDTWSQSLTTVNEFIDNFITKPNKTTGYLAQYHLFQQIPQLREDIIIPDYCYVGESDEDVQVNAWSGLRLFIYEFFQISLTVFLFRSPGLGPMAPSHLYTTIQITTF
jgi:lysine-specific demethylase 8